VGNFNSNFADKRLQNLALSIDNKIGFVPNLEMKEDKKKETAKEKIFSNPYEEYIKTWEPGDPLPLIPPGKVLHICKFHPNQLAVSGEVYETQERYKNSVKLKSGQPSDIEYKILGRKLKENVESLLSRAIRATGRGLWVDDKNKLRCPPGSPNANQFTDITGSNCLIPSPRQAAQSGSRAVRGAVTGVAQRAAGIGQRIEQSFDAARATREQIMELGFSRTQQMMSVGGRLSPGPEDMAAISGRIGVPRPLSYVRPKRTGKPGTPRSAGFRGAPKIDEDVPLKPWLLGTREKVQRGKRATELARSLNDRIFESRRNKTTGNPGGLRMPDGSTIGDIREMENFVRVMSTLFPNVAETPEQAQNEWARVFNNSIPRNLTYINKIRARENLVTFWQGYIAETINNPAAGKLVTRINVNPNLDAAFEIDMGHFPPLPATTSAGTRAATKMGAAERGGVHISMNLNPLMFFSNAMNFGDFDSNGRANGISDTAQGDMHYMATHEFGHLVHFQQVFNQLGFDMQNMSRYPDVDALVGGSGRPPSWQPQSQSNAWRIDFRQARNPTGNKSIQLLIDAATNLSSRPYYGTRGGTRQELERDLNNFHNALAEAVHNNITDTEEERELMRRFAGGNYATVNSLETRAEYYAARRLFADPAVGPLGVQEPNPIDMFARAIGAEQNPRYTPADVKRILDGVGVSTFGVRPNKWNISGRMSVNQSRPTLKAQAVRKAVEKNYGPIRPKISGAMRSSQSFKNTMSSRVFKGEDFDFPGFYKPLPPGTENIDPDFYKPLPPGTENIDPGFNAPLPPGFQNINSRFNNALRQNKISGRMTASRIRKNKEGVPQHPRKPTYGPMLGNFEKIFENVSSWEEFKQKYNNQEIVFLDYETTGIVFDKYGRVLDNGTPTQIGAIKVRGGEIVDRFNIFVNPGQPLGQWSRDNLKDADGNPLTDEYLADKTPLDEAHRLLASFAGPNALMGVQNAGYDKDVLDDVLKKSGIDWTPSGWIDLKDMAGMTLPRWSEENQDGPSRIDNKGNRVPSNSLADITKYLGVNLGKDHHNADKDAEATAESMKKLIDGAIEKNWSTDVLNPEKRRNFVKKTEDIYESDIKEFDKELASYLVNRISGEMSSSPKNNTIKLNLMNTSNGSHVGGRQTRSYYQNLKKSLRWKGVPEPETLEQSEPKRISNRKKNISDIKRFLTNDENSEFTDTERVNLTENLNGLDPEFFEYLKNSTESDLLTDVRQAAIEFHAGIDRRPRVNIEPWELENIINNGLNAKSSSTSSAGLQELKKLYEANIGISPSMGEDTRPVIGYVVHSDTIFAETEEQFERFSKNNLPQKDRYNFELFGNSASNPRRGFNSIFGDAEIILKPEVGGRTSYGNGDWLENHIYPVDIDSSDSDVIGRALIDGVSRFDDRQMNSLELLYGKFKNNYDAYRKDNGKTRPEFRSTWANRDAFILGGFEPNEIEEIKIPYKEIRADKLLTKSIINGIVQESRFVDGEPLDRRSFSETNEQRLRNFNIDSNVLNSPSVESTYELKNSRKAEKISYNRVTGELEITYKNNAKGKFFLDRYSDWEQFQTDLNKTTTSKAADNLIKKLETGKIGKKVNDLPNPIANEYSAIPNFSPQTTFVPTSESPKNALNNVEKTIIQDLLYGVSLNEAIDKRIAVRINDLPRYESIQKDYKSLLKVLTASKLQNAANAQKIEFSVTNEFGLNVFSGISFDKNASKKSKAEEVLKNRIEKQIKNLIKELRKAQKEISEK